MGVMHDQGVLLHAGASPAGPGAGGGALPAGLRSVMSVRGCRSLSLAGGSGGSNPSGPVEIPLSPSDGRSGFDLRKAALLRSISLRDRRRSGQQEEVGEAGGGASGAGSGSVAGTGGGGSQEGGVGGEGQALSGLTCEVLSAELTGAGGDIQVCVQGRYI